MNNLPSDETTATQDPIEAAMFFRTTIVVEVLSNFKLENATFSDIADMKYSGDVYTREVSYSLETLIQSDLDEACKKYENLTPDDLIDSTGEN